MVPGSTLESPSEGDFRELAPSGMGWPAKWSSTQHCLAMLMQSREMV